MLAYFGVDPSMLVFRNFVEAEQDAQNGTGAEPILYLSQAYELLRNRFLLDRQPFTTVTEAAQNVTAVASAMIELSWKLAVCAEDAECDLTLSSPTQRELLDKVLSPSSTAAQFLDVPEIRYESRRTRHFVRMSMGSIPNLDPSELTVADALAIRRGDGFASFRDIFRESLDRYESRIGSGGDQDNALGEFEDSMADASAGLKKHASNSPFGSRLKQASIPAAVGVATSAVSSSLGGGYWGVGSAALTATASVIWSWLLGRKLSPDARIASRYCAMLSSPMPDRRPEQAAAR